MATSAPMVISIDAFDRERIWQKLWYAQRFFYTGRELMDTIDHMLWDLASRHAHLPIYCAALRTGIVTRYLQAGKT